MMQISSKKIAISKFPLRLMRSVRNDAEKYSRREGVSLNQFINVAVAEKLAYLRHEEWVASRPRLTNQRLKDALAILDRPTGVAPEPNDELPDDYLSIRSTTAYRRASGRK